MLSKLREELLYDEDFVCADRVDHPDLDGSLDLRRYTSLRHLQVSRTEIRTAMLTRPWWVFDLVFRPLDDIEANSFRILLAKLGCKSPFRKGERLGLS